MVDHDATDPRTVPRDVRLAAFDAAMIALHAALTARGYLLDPIAELELVDERLAELRDDGEPERLN